MGTRVWALGYGIPAWVLGDGNPAWRRIGLGHPGNDTQANGIQEG
ncbi:MAG: hypothetical protein ACRCYU_12505 [Nocardioides sp.]